MNNETEKAILTGGESATVTLQGGSTETVTVRLLTIKEFPDYLRLVDDEERLAEFICDKPEGWAETLTVDSLLDIAEKAHALNFKNACRWGQRRAQINEALLPIAARGQAIQSACPNFAPMSESSSAKPRRKSQRA